MRQDITKRLLPAILVSLVLVLASTVLPVAAADPRVLASWSASGPGIAIHGDEVYVTEWDQCRVRVFNATGGFLREWGTEGSGDGQFIRPFAIAAGPDGTVYVTDWVNNRVQAFNATGGFLAKWGTSGTEPGQFYQPEKMAFDSAGQVYVNDKQRVQAFAAPVLARFSANVTGGSAPLAVRFTDGSTNGPTTWSWAFGDGGTSGDQHPVHVYAAPGTYTVTLEVSSADGGSDTETKTGYVTVARPIVPVPPSTALPTDMDADGLYEDVNGNDRREFADVVLYFNSMTWIAANEPLGAFDYNGNGRIDFADVVWLFNNL